uniref:Uncharacterized protein n=1 Tax=Panagrolaimus sp. ES5 TaxID=591445 RepID=A0AC34GJE8_9BILA
EAARKGSIIAQQHLDIWKNINEAMEAFKKNDSAKLVSALSNAIHLDHQIVEIPDMFKTVIEERYKSHPNELETGICYIRINSKNPEFPKIVNKYFNIYPEDEFLIEMTIAGFICFERYKEALEAATLAIKFKPKSPIMLYNYAIVLCLQDSPGNECIKALDAFISVAPRDHRYIPACFY